MWGRKNRNGLPPADGESNPEWERGVLERLAFAAVHEQRRTRRWNIFFRLAFLLYFIAFLLLVRMDGLAGDIAGRGPHTAVVRVEGVIAANAAANADAVIRGLEKAFENGDARGVVVQINSPGGSPVQAGRINAAMQRLRDEYPQKPLYGVVGDICASGGYYVAVGTDAIYADAASLVGSIGVVLNGFGFVEAMREFGVERRLYTAGEHKGFLDPFSPVDPAIEAHINEMLDTVHRQFIDVVRTGRGERLGDDPELFSGLIWTGEESVDLGLVDGLGDAPYVARELVGAERLVDYTREPDLLTRLSRQMGASMANTLAEVFGAGAPLR